MHRLLLYKEPRTTKMSEKIVSQVRKEASSKHVQTPPIYFAPQYAFPPSLHPSHPNPGSPFPAVAPLTCTPPSKLPKKKQWNDANKWPPSRGNLMYRCCFYFPPHLVLRRPHLVPRRRRELELPVGVIDRLDGPVELLPQRLGEELLDRDVELAREDDGETRVNVVLPTSLV